MDYKWQTQRVFQNKKIVLNPSFTEQCIDFKVKNWQCNSPLSHTQKEQN